MFQITTDPVHQPPETTWDIVSNLPGKIEQTVGDLDGWRPGIEGGFKRAKDALGWADYRVTDFHAIERWWELVMSVATLVALQRPACTALSTATAPPPDATLLAHPPWDGAPGWKRTLNNLRLLLQPYVCACLLLPWLRVLPLPHLHAGLADLCTLMNTFHPAVPT
ncbi:MAG TPA: hypothetical protein VGP82_00030 [Ktedonobacterales bacterium]|nr:hypothetical protein [Ktedonobacterales bacterium]